MCARSVFGTFHSIFSYLWHKHVLQQQQQRLNDDDGDDDEDEDGDDEKKKGLRDRDAWGKAYKQKKLFKCIDR